MPSFFEDATTRLYYNEHVDSSAWRQRFNVAVVAWSLAMLVILGMCAFSYVKRAVGTCPNCKSKRMGKFCSSCGAEMTSFDRDGSRPT
jgi:hypothetical protein